jgi:hypothetical protein
MVNPLMEESWPLSVSRRVDERAEGGGVDG